MNAKDDLVINQLSQLRDMEMAKMDSETYLAWQKKIDDVRNRYNEARRTEVDDNRTEDERQHAKEVADSIAETVPAITKSVIAAVTAFNNGDALTGSAELMEICAGISSLIGTFLAAAGPEG